MANTDIFLKPGDWFFGKTQGTATTILGSCVSLVLWQPERKLIGISHALLPHRPSATSTTGLSARFADEVVLLLSREITKHQLKPMDFQAKLFGGGDMFCFERMHDPVGEKNIRAFSRMLNELDVDIVQSDLGGQLYRKLTICMATGQVEVKCSPVNCFELVAAAEKTHGVPH
ncbi:chemotaxis protein CheD [Alkalimonas sp. MEB108]|uniref:Probable chemoreceptor glutamine deamidase CheD n=1 Tax=Alkalimonas cellulosilytica TaxID=3058395 RepID=A0ABU7J7B4_9GAMM|nr:chemotaxis protein CheD [Alkalimonas sp. MEB108]MEE2002299.1 chemotaxis protein CheD [Alkalimonas sp. MEB108]